MLSRLVAIVALAAVLATAPAVAGVIHVPGQVPTLSQAVSAVPNGGTIEIAAGTYPSPSGGWFFGNLGKSFTIRAAAGATVILDGGNARPVFRLQNTSSAFGGQVTFENLVFANGRSTQEAVAGGVTVDDNDAVFAGCTFQNNTCDAATTGGGGAIVFGDADVWFLGCSFTANRATNEGGGLKVGEGARVVVHDSVFDGNRVNLAGHRPSSAGGGLHIGNADVVVSNSRFQGNQAGYVGGGLYTIGTWQSPPSVPRSTVDVVNCTFVDNVAQPYPGVTTPSRTEGGALHAEDQALVRIDGCRFVTNDAETGGGVNLYRARVEIANSVFRGNRATAVGAGTGFGGALSAISNDTSADGTTNRPVAVLTVTDTLVQCSYGSVGSVGQIGGGIYASGDQNRQYGRNGVPASPNLSANRAQVSLNRSVISGCVVVQSSPGDGTGSGGAGMFDLADVTVADSAVLASTAAGSDSHGGGLRAIGQSLLTVDDTTLAGNRAGRFGGAFYVQGAEARIDGCAVIENTDDDDLYGAAIFSAPDEGIGVSVTGYLANSVVSNTADRGLLIFDDDRQWGPTSPYNDLRYNGNTIFDRGQGANVYQDPIAGGPMPVSQLNSLIVVRANGTPSTDKSQVDNIDPASAPVVASIVAAPPRRLRAGAAGDPVGPTEAFVGYGWTGGSATLDGSPVTGYAGLSSVGVGSHVLSVAGTQDVATVALAAEPGVSLGAFPVAIPSGGSAELEWATSGGTFLAAVMDHGVVIPSVPGGEVVVWPTVTTTYTVYVLTEEGGSTASATVYVDESPPPLFADDFESGTTSAWSSVLP